MKTRNFTLHKLEQNDVDAFVELRLAFALELSGKQSESAIQELREQVRNYFLKSIADKTSLSYLALCEGKNVGIGTIIIRQQAANFKNLSGKWGYIMNMYTLPEFRRQGICKAILDILIEDAKSHGIHAFELHATAEGEKVYVQNGFELYPEPTYRKYVS